MSTVTPYELKLMREIAATIPKAKLAKATTAKLPSPPVPGLGLTLPRGSRWFPWNWPGNAIDAYADHVIEPILERTGYMVPTEKEVETAQRSVDALKENIERREIRDDPPPPSTYKAAEVGQENVDDMDEARKKVLNIPDIRKLWEKAKMYALVGGGVVGSVLLYGLYQKVSGR